MKISLQQMRKMDLFEEVDPPEIVYHMTSRENAEKIQQDRKVKCFDDYLTFFFPSIDQIPIYIAVTGADSGREHYDSHGRPVKELPLDHEDTVVLKLLCRKEPLAWYKENNTKNSQLPEPLKAMWRYMDNARVCHYGDLRFRRVEEVIPLTEIDKMQPPEAIEIIRKLQEIK